MANVVADVKEEASIDEWPLNAGRCPFPLIEGAQTVEVTVTGPTAQSRAAALSRKYGNRVTMNKKHAHL